MDDWSLLEMTTTFCPCSATVDQICMHQVAKVQSAWITHHSSLTIEDNSMIYNSKSLHTSFWSRETFV